MTCSVDPDISYLGISVHRPNDALSIFDLMVVIYKVAGQKLQGVGFGHINSKDTQLNVRTEFFCGKGR